MSQPVLSSTERELVAAVRRGDDRAFEELYTRYRGRIGSYVFGMVGDHGRAEDISQDAFMSALRRLRATEHPVAFKPWMYEIAKNACIDEFRRTRRKREVPLEADEDLTRGASGMLSAAPTPEAVLEGKQRLDDLKGAFGGLSESHHRIIVLRELEGLSYSEIAERMGISRSMVESTLFRARRRLRGEYDELVSGRRCTQVQTAIEDGAPPLRNLRVRERRQLTRHLAHCQPCRRHAMVAGVDESILAPPGLAGKVAAFLPLPISFHWLRWPRGGAHKHVVSGHASHAGAGLHSVHVAAPFTGAAGAVGGHGLAAAAATVVAIAGVGGGLVVVAQSQQAHQAPAARVASAPVRAAVGGGGTGGAAGVGRAGAGGVHRLAFASVGKNGAASAVGPAGGSHTAAHRSGSTSVAPGGLPAGSGPRTRGTSSTRTISVPVPTPRTGKPPSTGPGPTPIPPVSPPSIRLPTLPPIGLPPIRLPALPPITLPPIGLPGLPPIGLPPISLPTLPPIRLPPIVLGLRASSR